MCEYSISLVLFGGGFATLTATLSKTYGRWNDKDISGMDERPLYLLLRECLMDK